MKNSKIWTLTRKQGRYICRREMGTGVKVGREDRVIGNGRGEQMELGVKSLTKGGKPKKISWVDGE